VQSPFEHLVHPIGHLTHLLSLSSNPSAQLKQILIFLGSQLPLQLPRHLTHFPSSLRALPTAQVMQMEVLLGSHYKQPRSH
jgi:hypothetical protein